MEEKEVESVAATEAKEPDRNQAHEGNADRKTKHGAANKRLAIRASRGADKLLTSSWIGVVGLMLLSPLLYRGGAVQFIWVGLGCCLLVNRLIWLHFKSPRRFWIVTGVCNLMIIAMFTFAVARALTIEHDMEAAEQREKEQMRSEIADLRPRVDRLAVDIASQLPRTLTLSQKKVITETMRPYSGSTIVLECPLFNDEAKAYASDFAVALSEAGMGFAVTEGSGFLPNFNLQLCVGPDGKTMPDALAVLGATLARLGLLADGLHAQVIAGIPPGEMRLRIGAQRTPATVPSTQSFTPR